MFGYDFGSTEGLQIIKIRQISRILTEIHLRGADHRGFGRKDPRQQSSKLEKSKVWTCSLSKHQTFPPMHLSKKL